MTFERRPVGHDGPQSYRYCRTLGPNNQFSDEKCFSFLFNLLEAEDRCSDVISDHAGGGGEQRSNDHSFFASHMHLPKALTFKVFHDSKVLFYLQFGHILRKKRLVFTFFSGMIKHSEPTLTMFDKLFFFLFFCFFNVLCKPKFREALNHRWRGWRVATLPPPPQ